MSRSIASASGVPKGHAAGISSRASGLESSLKPMRNKKPDAVALPEGVTPWPGIAPQISGIPHDPRSIPNAYYHSDYTQDPAAYRFLPGTVGFQKQLSSADIALFELARDEDQQKAYDDWLAQNIDLSNIHESRWLRRIEPEYFERRKAWLDDKHRAVEFITKMRVFGPQTLQDLQTLWVLENRHGEGDPDQASQYWGADSYGSNDTVSTRDERRLQGGFTGDLSSTRRPMRMLPPEAAAIPPGAPADAP